MRIHHGTTTSQIHHVAGSASMRLGSLSLAESTIEISQISPLFNKGKKSIFSRQFGATQEKSGI